MGLLLRRSSGKGLHLAITGEPRGFSRVTAGVEQNLPGDRRQQEGVTPGEKRGGNSSPRARGLVGPA